MSSTLAVELDDARLSRTAPGTAQWRWENVEKAPQWVSGARPRYSLRDRLDVMTLRPGESTTFKVPARGAIRVVRMDGELAAGDLQIWVSNGSGLYRHLLSGINRDDGSLIAVPDASGPSLARVVHAGERDCPLRVSVFTSRFLAPEFIDGYRCEVKGCGDAHKVSDSIMGPRVSSEYYLLATQKKARITVTGPCRLELATRYVYSEQDNASLQPYRIYAHPSSAPPRILEYETTSEQRTHVHVGGCELLVGKREVAYLDVPAGEQTLEFDASACVLLQARLLDCDLYRNVKYNGPGYFPRQQRSANRPETYGSIWQIPPTDVARFLRFDPTDAVAQAGLALRSVRDNRFQQGGLRASMMMLAAAAGRPDEPTVRQFAEHLLNSRTLYRDLLPQWQDQGVRPQGAFFIVRSLRRPHRSHNDVIVGEQLVGDSVSRLTSGQFLPVGSCWANAGYYALPENLGPSMLRVAVDESSLCKQTRLHIQFDERSPILLDASPACDLKLGHFNPSRGETALAALNHLHAPFDSGTLGGPFAAHNDPAPLISAGSSELLIPAGVRSVRIWATGDLGKRPRVALQYRTSKHYRLTEPAYYDAVRRTGLSSQALLSSLINQVELASDDPFAFQEVRNHWVPLVRMLRAKHDQVMAQLSLPLASKQRGPNRAASREQLELAETARQLATHGQWLPSLEAWAKLVDSPQEGLRREALLGRAKALEALHEVSFAKNELTGVYFSEQHDLLLKQLAYDALLDLLLRQEDLKGLEDFLITTVVEEPTPEHVYDLAEVFVARGRYGDALLLGLMTPDPSRIDETMLRAAFQRGWWRTYDRFVQGLEPGQSDLWRALKLMKRGKLAAAKHHFEAAGRVGQPWLNHLEVGESILEKLSKLSEADATECACAVHAWEAWQAYHPGPRTWREEGALVAECPGTASVYNVGRDVYRQFYAADPGNPLRLMVHGPVDLRFEVRPLHSAGAIEPMDDWLSIKLIEPQTEAAIVPITGNRIDLNQRIVGAGEAPEFAAGKSITAHYRVGPGRHEITVSAEQARSLVRVFAARPEMPLTVLPQINDASLAAMKLGRYRNPQTAQFYWKRNLIHPRHDVIAHLLPLHCDEAVHLPFVQHGPHSLDFECPDVRASGTCSGECTLCDQIAGCCTTEPTCGNASPDASCTLGGATVRRTVDPLLNSRAWASHNESPWRVQMQHLANVDIQGALNVSCEDDPMAMRQRMALLAYLAEKEPSRATDCYAAATQLLEQNPDCPALSGMRFRISRKLSWKLWQEYEAGAGIYTLKISDWMPEQPGLRTRKAMLGDSATGDALLSGSQTLALDVRNVADSLFTFVLRRPPVGFLATGPMRVVCQVDSQPEQLVELNEAGAEQRVEVKLAAGQHRVRLWHADPYLNQFTLVTVLEQAVPQGAASTYSIDKPKRVYQAATHDEPIRFRVPGPATLRIDELRGTRTLTSIEVIEDGSREIVLRPLPGEEMALFRVWEMRDDPLRMRLLAHHAPVEPTPVPTSWLENSCLACGVELPLHAASSDWFAPGAFVPGQEAWGDPLSLTSLLPPDGNAPWLSLDDTWKLGQEDGTTAFHLGKYNRRALEEADRVGLPDKFTQFGFTQFEFDRWNDKYWKTERFSRMRQKGGRTMGYGKTCHFSLPPRWTWVPRQMQGLWGSRDPFVKRHPINVFWSTKGYVQQTESVVARLDGDLEWGAVFNGRLSRRRQLSCKTYHMPSASIFRRIMSMENNRYAPGEIDQDVFTEFKNDHRYGYVFKDRFVFQPRLDRRWWLEPSFYSNEDFRMDRPDHLSVRVGHSRLTGPLYLDGSYRCARYFRDSDRDAYATQHLVYLQSRLGGWLDSGNRVELTSGFSHDITGKRSSAYMRFTWYFSRGRGGEDFHGSDLPFANLQTQNALPAWFNAGGFSDN